MIAHVAVFGRRAGAVLAACSAVLHGIAVVHAPNLAATALTVAMLAACILCACDLWIRGTLRAWVLVALMNLAMIAIHTPASPAHHHGGGVTAAAPVHHSTVMALATALAAVEVGIAAAVVYFRTRAVRPEILGVDWRGPSTDTSLRQSATDINRLHSCPQEVPTPPSPPGRSERSICAVAQPGYLR
jgi:hypothetical protein